MRSCIFGMITTAGSRRYTPYAVESFFNNTPLSPQDRFLLIDNDGSLDDPKLLENPRIEVIRNKNIQGFGTNMNMVLREAYKQNSSVVLLNNDIIFTPDWMNIDSQKKSSISSPISSREFEYTFEDFNCRNPMELDEYIGHEEQLKYIAAENRKKNPGSLNVFVVPFFASFLPAIIIQSVGLLDESFGSGGGEDYDYCLRAILAGYQVEYILNNYVLHFGGKSSWSGVESKEAQEARERIFFNRFEEKWGKNITDIILRNRMEPLTTNAEYKVYIDNGRLKEIIEVLLKKDLKHSPTPFLL